MLVIILENTDYTAAIADPNLQAFASSGVLFSNWDAIGHPSQPNYIALTSGSTNGITNDNSKTINVQNVADLLEAKGLTWKSYQENWPGNCFTGSVSKDDLYFRLV
jgi:Phosphoesterase family